MCPPRFFLDFLGSNDIKVVKFECMGFKVWRSNRLLSLSLRLFVAETPESRHLPTHVTFKCSFWVVWVHCSEPLSIMTQCGCIVDYSPQGTAVNIEKIKVVWDISH